jgi:Zn-dependent protease
VEFGTDFTTLALTLISIIAALSIHEAMHAYVGHKLGDDTALEHGRVSFNPIKHIDPITTVLMPIVTLFLFGVPILAAKPVPFNPTRVKWGEYGAALIGIAGPVSNILMAIVAAVLVRLIGTVGFATNALTLFAAINVGIFVFNMVPIPPLDGSRLLYAFAPEPIQEIMARMETFGLFIVFALVIMFQPFSTLLININTAILRFLL